MLASKSPSRASSWSAEEDEKLTLGANDGTQFLLIAEALGRTVASVQTRMTKLGIRRKV